MKYKINIDFSKEPYKSMIDPEDPEYSKRLIRTIVSFVGEPDANGNFKISRREVDELTRKYLSSLN